MAEGFQGSPGGASVGGKIQHMTPTSSLSRFPLLKECAHFHYETVELSKIKVCAIKYLLYWHISWCVMLCSPFEQVGLQSSVLESGNLIFEEQELYYLFIFYSLGLLSRYPGVMKIWSHWHYQTLWSTQNGSISKSQVVNGHGFFAVHGITLSCLMNNSISAFMIENSPSYRIWRISILKRRWRRYEH